MSGTPDVDFPPVLNGVDYLESVLGLLRATPGPRELKYAVLHLQAATEVLLKARVIQSDWRQVWLKPGQANEAAYKSGEFRSCGLEEAIERLAGLGVVVEPAMRSEIKLLGRQRNRLQHFGLTENALAVESRAAGVLDFLLEFVRVELLPGLSGNDAAVTGGQLDQAHASLAEITSLVTARLARIEPALDAAADRTVVCPACGQTALVVSGEATAACLFCTTSWQDSHEAATAYADGVLGLSWYETVTDGAAEPVYTCAWCDQLSVVRGARLRAAPEREDDFCFHCAEILTGMLACENGCGTLTDNETGLCVSCLAIQFDRF